MLTVMKELIVLLDKQNHVSSVYNETHVLTTLSPVIVEHDTGNLEFKMLVVKPTCTGYTNSEVVDTKPIGTFIDRNKNMFLLYPTNNQSTFIFLYVKRGTINIEL